MRRLGHSTMRVRGGVGSRRGRRGRAAGLTMLETMIALLVAAAGFGAIMTALSQSKRAEASATRAERELALAKNLLEQAFVGALPQTLVTRPSAGVERWTGVTDGIAWQVETHATVMKGFDLRKRDPALAALAIPSEGDAGGPVFTADLLRVHVGRVTLSAARW